MECNVLNIKAATKQVWLYFIRKITLLGYAGGHYQEPFEYPKGSLLKSNHQKKYLPNFLTTKRKNPKSPSIIPITRIPEFHPAPPLRGHYVGQNHNVEAPLVEMSVVNVSSRGVRVGRYQMLVGLCRCLIILSPRQECTGSGSSKSNMEVCISGCVFSSLVYELENSRGDVVSGLSLACLQI